MIIHKLSPQGFCWGVRQAIQKVEQALMDPAYPKPIYLLGSIIHNKTVTDHLVQMGAILIEENRTRLSMLDRISTGTVVFSAHGVAPNVYEKAKQKGLTILDTTCGNVLIVHRRIKQHLEAGYRCYYIGTKNHPECEGILESSSLIRLIETKEDVENLPFTEEAIYITNQTTLSLLDTEIIYRTFKEKFPQAIIDNKICLATTQRQQAVLDQKKADLCLVVGDKMSSNTKKLWQLAQQKGIRSVLIEQIEDLAAIDFTAVQQINITSGASTPSVLVDQVINHLQNIK